ncbi:CatB-related O-acetyltransferase [Mucilaginibacter sp. SJ]|uniref:CatB-related O-acetyltransferase n=1 Tax=Mucilaginibacter sp. SJ TaxID=3029053 RepID=UPI003A7A5DF2
MEVAYNNYISNQCNLNNVGLDDFSYVGAASQLFNVKVGKFCSIADNVKIGLGFHPTDRVSTHPSFYSNNKAFKCFANENLFNEYKETVIENDVWIGSNAIIFGGITIGNGSVVAGGSIVTKDVEPYAIVGGNPAKLIKYRFEEDIIKKLLSFKWWSHDLSWIEANYKSFNDMELFFKLTGITK